MQRNKRERFQTRVYLRRLQWLKTEMRDWRDQYRAAMVTHQDDWLGSRVAERAEAVDDVWHLCDQAMSTLAWMS